MWRLEPVPQQPTPGPWACPALPWAPIPGLSAPQLSAPAGPPPPGSLPGLGDASLHRPPHPHCRVLQLRCPGSGAGSGPATCQLCVPEPWFSSSVGWCPRWADSQLLPRVLSPESAAAGSRGLGAARGTQWCSISSGYLWGPGLPRCGLVCAVTPGPNQVTSTGARGWGLSASSWGTWFKPQGPPNPAVCTPISCRCWSLSPDARPSRARAAP